MATRVQAILQQHDSAFAASHPLAPYQQDAAEALRDCRTAALGGHWRSCPNGHVPTAHFDSCHHRSCHPCATLAREQWLAAWKQCLLDCAHTHTIFTAPQDLVPLWRYNKQLFMGLLFRAPVDALRELLADPKYLGALPGLEQRDSLGPPTVDTVGYSLTAATAADQSRYRRGHRPPCRTTRVVPANRITAAVPPRAHPHRKQKIAAASAVR